MKHYFVQDEIRRPNFAAIRADFENKIIGSVAKYFGNISSQNRKKRTKTHLANANETITPRHASNSSDPRTQSTATIIRHTLQKQYPFL